MEVLPRSADSKAPKSSQSRSGRLDRVSASTLALLPITYAYEANKRAAMALHRATIRAFPSVLLSAERSMLSSSLRKNYVIRIRSGDDGRELLAIGGHSGTTS